MSTTIKPLELIVEGTKVYPDVDLSILGSPLATSSTFIQMNTTANNILSSHNSNVAGSNSGIIIMPDIEDGDTSPFHTNNDYGQDYWFFSSYRHPDAYITEIQPELDAKWLANAYLYSNVDTFRKTTITSITFKQGTKLQPWTALYDNTGNVAYKANHCGAMFMECYNLTSINNLDLTESQVFNDINNIYEVHNTINGEYVQDPNWTYSYMFQDCNNLRVLDVVWPTYLYGSFNGMFNNCSSLPENQLPELKFRPLGVTIDGTAYNTIDLSEVFSGCSNFTSLHIDSGAWPYIKTIYWTWRGTQVKSIDIPATATNLETMYQCLGDLPSEMPNDDWSAYKFIIRTTTPMNAYNNDQSYEHILLINHWNYDQNPDFISTFGGIYVPDAQLQDYRDFYANWGGEDHSTFANNCVHGLSEL